MSWWTGGALGFDTETDGPEPTEARIITAATVLVIPDAPPIADEVLVQPERDIPQGAIDVHGITTEHARENGSPREVAVMHTAMTIADVACAEIPLVGHNVPYDLTLLDREMRRLGIGYLGIQGPGHPESGFVVVIIDGKRAGAFPVIDTMVLDKAVDKFRRGKRQLSHVAAHYGVPMDEGAAHGATADVFASLRIAWRISKLCSLAMDYVMQHGGPVLSSPMILTSHPFMRHYGGRKDPLEIVRTFATVGGLELAELHAHQKNWALAQAESLREHFMTSGTGDPNGVDGRWPIRPMNVEEAVEIVDTAVL